jgi:hypothetical protein
LPGKITIVRGRKGGYASSSQMDGWKAAEGRSTAGRR